MALPREFGMCTVYTKTVHRAHSDGMIRAGILAQPFRKAAERKSVRPGRRPLTPLKGRGQDLSLAGIVDRLGEDARGLGGGVESHRVLGRDEIEAPLGLALQL